MTIVVASNFIDQLIIAADTRVSMDNNIYYPNVGLIKVSLFNFRATPVVIALAFCGRISAGGKILDYVIKKKLNNYNSDRPIAFTYLADKLEGWISEIVQTIRSDELKDTALMFCGFELLRTPTFNKQKPSQAHFFEPYMVTYTIDMKTQIKKVIRERHFRTAIIGSGRIQKERIDQQTYIFQNALGSDIAATLGAARLEEARSVIVADSLIQLFRDNQPDYKIGGPFQIVALTPHHPARIRFWWAENRESSYDESEVRVNKSHYTLSHKKTGQKFTLRPFDYWYKFSRGKADSA